MENPTYIPIYHNTNDQRIKNWVYKNLTTHELKNAQTTTAKILQPDAQIFLTEQERTLGSKEMEQSPCKGNVRAFLCFIALIFIVFVIFKGMGM